MLVDDDAGIGRDGDLTICEGIERVNGLVGRNARIQVNHDFALFGGVVVDFLNLDFAFIVALHDALNETSRSRSVGYLTDYKCFLILLTDSCTNTNLTATQTIIVVSHVHHATRRDIGIERKRLVFQICYRSVNQFVEIVGQELGSQTHGNAFGALCQQQRKLHW